MKMPCLKRIYSLVLIIALLTCAFVSVPIQATEVEPPAAEATTTESVMNLSAKIKKQVTVYKEASTSTEKVIKLNKNQEILIKGELTVAGAKWYRITAKVGKKNYKGYIRTKYAKKYNMFAQNTGKTNTNVTLRSAMSTSSKKIATLKKGTSLTAMSKAKKGKYNWYYVSVKVNGKTKKGYVVTNYVTLTTTTASNTKAEAAKVKAKTGIYKTANTKDQKLNTLQPGTELYVRGEVKVKKTTWYKVQTMINDKKVTGYVKKSKVEGFEITDYTKMGVATLNKKYKLKDCPNALGKTVATAKKGMELVLDGFVQLGEVTWYRCAYFDKIAYVPSTVITMKDEPSADAFYADILNFPESYHAGLTALHEVHPNWKFVAVDTALVWKDVVAAQNVVGKNVIQSNYPKGGSTLAPFSYLSTQEGAYDWATDTYKVKDGSNWYCAAEAVIAHYLDPRNFLTESGIYQFEALSYDSNQKKKVVTAILKDSFMNGSFSVVDKLTGETVTGKYNSTFMTAGKQAGASPYFLSRSALLEVGSTGSGSVSGTYPGYEGIYNFYNIGAYDSSTGEAIKHGLEWASGGSSGLTTYNRPWTTPAKSIIGGASYIAEKYINMGQNTSYFKKFNVVNYTDGLYNHQYYTNVQGASVEASIAKRAYASCGIDQDAMVFYIPYYDGMPETACALPEAAGNPNYYLKSITVTDAATGEERALSETFKYKEPKYTCVANGATSVTISAKTISKHATITINGTAVSSGDSVTVDLVPGETTTVKVVCKAGNGEKFTYQIKIA